MKEETADFFAKARKKLADAATLLSVGLYEDAGRNCYLAGMNATRGLLFEHGFQMTKRHKTLYGALSQALHERGIHDAKLTAFLPGMANLKAIADYEATGDGVTKAHAEKAIAEATQFVDAICSITAAPAGR